jgi:alpha-beta hydrolase superfamily lysophospholipase
MVAPLASALGDLHDNAEACRRTIAAAADGPVVLLGHSYGGIVITEGGADDRVSRPEC